TAPATDDGRVIADELIDIYGSPLWDRLSEAQRVELNRRIAAWRLSTLMYGEQGAMLACSQLVDVVEGADHKFFQATQVMDESRHMGFGMLSLPRVVSEASETERRELEDYTCFALEKTLTGFFPAEAYRDMGFSPAEMDEVRRYRRETAASNDYAPFRKYFRKDMHSSMVQNLARIGLLSDRVRPRLERLGISLPTP